MQWEYARHNDPWTKRAICNLYTPCDEGHAERDVETNAREEERDCKYSIGAETGVDTCTGQYERRDLHNSTQAKQVAPFLTDGIFHDEDIHSMMDPSSENIDFATVVQKTQGYIGDEVCLEEPRSTVCPHIRPLHAHEIEAGCKVFPCEWERCNRHDGTADSGEYP